MENVLGKTFSYLVRVGSSNVETIGTTLVTLGAESFISHPKYEEKVVYFDAGIVVTKTPIFYNDYIRPICLPGCNAIKPFFCH